MKQPAHPAIVMKRKLQLLRAIIFLSLTFFLNEVGHAQFTPPQINRQPQSQSVPLGRNATFTVEAFSTTEMSYQWRFNGVNI